MLQGQSIDFQCDILLCASDLLFHLGFLESYIKLPQGLDLWELFIRTVVRFHLHAFGFDLVNQFRIPIKHFEQLLPVPPAIDLFFTF